ncbi:adenylate cyclase-like protein [Dermatophagoides farinae]|uniref:Adenylate cyclase-like protein n=1 Tax=Dermatophagoides farinae TaxID=6954 RepID=A0A9D4SK29_DERFA|nr:adenylate cyclase-like protein [Dermatophagoides farinae]
MGQSIDNKPQQNRIFSPSSNSSQSMDCSQVSNLIYDNDQFKPPKCLNADEMNKINRRFDRIRNPTNETVSHFDDNANLISSSIPNYSPDDDSDNHRNVSFIENTRPDYESDDSYYAEDENDDHVNNNNNNNFSPINRHQFISDNESNSKHRTSKTHDCSMDVTLLEQSMATTTNATETFAANNENLTEDDGGYLDNGAISDLNSMFNECPDSRMEDFDRDFEPFRHNNHSFIRPLRSIEDILLNDCDDGESMISIDKSSSVHETTDCTSEFLYDSDAAFNQQATGFIDTSTSNIISNNNNHDKLLVTDLDSLESHFGLPLLQNDNQPIDDNRLSPSSSKHHHDSKCSFDINMNHHHNNNNNNNNQTIHSDIVMANNHQDENRNEINV